MEWNKLQIVVGVMYHFRRRDMVFLKLHPYRQHSIFRRAHQKLESKFYGSYPIKKKVGVVAYKLKLPKGAWLHSIFHVSLLKKKVGDKTMTSPEFPLIADDGTIVVELEDILDTFWVKQGTKFFEEGLVKWCRLVVEDAMWESIDELMKQYPNLDLEDKRPLGGGSNDASLQMPRSPQCVIKRNPKYLAWWHTHRSHANGLLN